MTEDQIKLDWERRRRLGFDEAVFCAGKSTAQLTTILDQVAAAEERMLLTRLDEAGFAELPDIHRDALDYDPVSRTAFYGPNSSVSAHHVALVTAGTSDVPVAAEAERTLAFNGIGTLSVHDVGVAGLWRLVERIDEIKAMPVVIVVAGMDGALPSVVRRSGPRPCDRGADVHRLWCCAQRRDCPKRCARLLCARPLGLQYRQRLWRCLRCDACSGPLGRIPA